MGLRGKCRGKFCFVKFIDSDSYFLQQCFVIGSDVLKVWKLVCDGVYIKKLYKTYIINTSRFYLTDTIISTLLSYSNSWLICSTIMT